MSIAKVIEITAESPDGFKSAIKAGVKKASETVNNITGAWVKDQQVVVQDGEVTRYRVNLKVTFILK